jgi:hypothetical protein
MFHNECSLDISVSTATGLRAGRPGFDSRQLQGTFLSSIVFKLALGTTQPPDQWIMGALSAGLKRQGREANHSPPSNAEVKNS